MVCVVVGVGGCSNGGKTSLANAIEKQFENVVVMNMDNFYRDDDDPEVELLEMYDAKFANWDSLQSFNMPKFLKEFKDLYKKLDESQEMNILVAEGVFIFLFSEIENYFFKKYLLDLPYDEALKRRRSACKVRKYPREEPEDYFEKVTWPAHVNIKETIKNKKEITYLDGTKPRAEIINFVLEDIRSSLCKT